MKALVRKDLYMLQSFGKLFLLVFTLFAVVPDLQFFPYSSTYAVMLSLYLMQSDEQCKWDSLLPMLPISRRLVVLEKYLLGWAYLALMTVVALVSQLIWVRFDMMPLDGQYFTMLCIDLAIGFLMQAVSLPVIFRFGTNRGRPVLFFAVAFATLLTVIVLNDRDFGSLLSLLVHIRGWHILVAAVLVSVATIPLSIHLYEKRILK